MVKIDVYGYIFEAPATIMFRGKRYYKLNSWNKSKPMVVKWAANRRERGRPSMAKSIKGKIKPSYVPSKAPKTMILYVLYSVTKE